MPHQRIQPAELVDLPLFTQVIKAGATVYVAGQVALDRDGQVVGQGDITVQTDRVFQNLQTALAAAGATFSDLVKLTIYATDAAYLRPIAEVRRRYLGTPDPVTSTFVAVAGLARPELLVEIEAIAVLDDAAAGTPA